MSADSEMSDLTGSSELLRLLEIEFEEVGPARVSGSVAAAECHHQPWRLMHGGLYTTVIETFATSGAYEAVKARAQRVEIRRPEDEKLIARGQVRLQNVEA